MINDQLRYLIITNFVPQNEYSANINSTFGILEYSNFTNLDHTDFDDFKAQFVFSVRKKILQGTSYSYFRAT